MILFLCYGFWDMSCDSWWEKQYCWLPSGERQYFSCEGESQLYLYRTVQPGLSPRPTFGMDALLFSLAGRNILPFAGDKYSFIFSLCIMDLLFWYIKYTVQNDQLKTVSRFYGTVFFSCLSQGDCPYQRRRHSYARHSLKTKNSSSS